LNIQIAFGSIAIFTTLILGIHEQGRSSIFYNFLSSMVFSFPHRGY
jgi:hypothetical protein